MSEDSQEVLKALWERCEERFEVAEFVFQRRYFNEAATASFFSAFYAVTALLLTRGFDYRKHSAVRSALHKQFIKTGDLPTEIGDYYDYLESIRHIGDYGQLKRIHPADSRDAIEQARKLIQAVREYLDAKGIPYK